MGESRKKKKLCGAVTSFPILASSHLSDVSESHCTRTHASLSSVLLSSISIQTGWGRPNFPLVITNETHRPLPMISFYHPFSWGGEKGGVYGTAIFWRHSFPPHLFAQSHANLLIFSPLTFLLFLASEIACLLSGKNFFLPDAGQYWHTA